MQVKQFSGKECLDERLDEITGKISDIHGRVVEQADGGNKDLERGQFAASVIDRLFLILSGMATCLSVIFFYLMIPQYEG